MTAFELRCAIPLLCPKCGQNLADLRGVGISAEQFRREDGRCFLINRNTFECRTGGPYHGAR